MFALWASAAFAQSLPSWNEGAAKQAILQFVADVTTPGSPDLVPAEERVAVLDNDGTLWAEQPLYFQFVFMLEQLKQAAPQHPEWKTDPAFKALMAHDQTALAKLGLKPVLKLLGIANSGMTTVEYNDSIRTWLATAREPRFPITRMRGRA
jgi:hypothetical protein